LSLKQGILSREGGSGKIKPSKAARFRLQHCTSLSFTKIQSWENFKSSETKEVITSPLCERDSEFLKTNKKLVTKLNWVETIYRDTEDKLITCLYFS